MRKTVLGAGKQLGSCFAHTHHCVLVGPSSRHQVVVNLISASFLHVRYITGQWAVTGHVLGESFCAIKRFDKYLDPGQRDLSLSLWNPLNMYLIILMPGSKFMSGILMLDIGWMHFYLPSSMGMSREKMTKFLSFQRDLNLPLMCSQVMLLSNRVCPPKFRFKSAIFFLELPNVGSSSLLFLFETDYFCFPFKVCLHYSEINSKFLAGDLRKTSISLADGQ